MARMTGEEIFKVVKALIGDVSATGDSAEDAKREENLDALMDLMEFCLDEIAYASISRTSQESSMRSIGRKAMKYLAESAEWFNAKKRQWDNENGD